MPITKNINLTNTILSAEKKKATGVFFIYLNAGVPASDFKMFVGATSIGIQIISKGITKTATLNNKTPQQIVAELNKAQLPLKIVPLNLNTPLAASDYLPISSEASYLAGTSLTDITTDGAFVVRAKIHNVQYDERTRIRLLAPYFSTASDPWYARINTGTINFDHNGHSYIFTVPEYDKQTWSLSYGRPYMSVPSETTRLLNNKTIKVARTPILWEKQNIRLIVDNRAYTSNNITDVDRWNGLIFTSTSLPTNSTINASYTYKEESLIYKKMNLNASTQHNPSILGRIVLYYLVPWQDERRRLNYFSCVRHALGSSIRDALGSIPDYGYPILPIGAIRVRENFNPQSINILDTRTRGGGIPDEDLEDSMSIPDINFFSDIGLWDGHAYPGNAVAVMTVPDRIHKVFTPEELRSRATKFLAAGVLTVTERTEDPQSSDDDRVINVSAFSNGTFSGASYWQSVAPTQINNFTGITNDDVFSINTSGVHLVLAPGERIAQRYIKTSAPTIIEYSERTSEDSITWGGWEPKKFFDDRTTSGVMLGGKLILDSGLLYKHVKDVTVDSGFSLSSTFTDDVETEIIKLFNNVTGLSDSSGRQIYTRTNVVNGSVSEVDWIGPTDEQLAILDMWPHVETTGYSALVGDAILGSLDTGSWTLPKPYNSASGYYRYSGQWQEWTNSVKYLSRLYEYSNNAKYYTGALNICTAIDAINPYTPNLIPAILEAGSSWSTDYFIPYRYKWNGTTYVSDTISMTYAGNFPEVRSSLIEADRLLDGAVAFSEFASDGIFALKATTAGERSRKYFASTTDGGSWGNTWYLDGVSFSGHNLYTFDLLGKAGSHNLINAVNILQNINSASVATASALATAITKMRTKLYPMVTGAAAIGGWIPYQSSECIRAMNLLQVTNIKTSLLRTMETLVKGHCDDNGNLYQNPSWQYRPTYISAQPNNQIFEMFADILSLDRSVSGFAQLFFYQNQYLYSAEYGYPADAKLVDGVGDNSLLQGLVKLYNSWSN